MVVNVTKISQKMKKINWLSIEENIIEGEKISHYNYKKHFNLENFASFSEKVKENFYIYNYDWKFLSQQI